MALCYVGNQNGASNFAVPFYIQMIENFFLREVEQLFSVITEDNYLKY